MQKGHKYKRRIEESKEINAQACIWINTVFIILSYAYPYNNKQDFCHRLQFAFQLEEAMSLQLSSIGTVQFNYNFTHAWYSMHGVLQVFACKIQKISVCIIISTRQDMSLPKVTRGICSKRVITRDVAVEVPILWGSTRISVGM